MHLLRTRPDNKQSNMQLVQGGSNMTGTDLCNKCKQSRSYLNHLVFTRYAQNMKNNEHRWFYKAELKWKLCCSHIINQAYGS